jgi:3-hydroxypropanoate dehydrogenase
METATLELDEGALDRLFFKARTHNTWQDRPVTDADIKRLYELAKWGPTTANSNPGRFVFIRSKAAKERLRPHLAAGNVDKTMSAPCTVIVAMDMHFYDKLPQLFPGRDLRSGYVGKDVTETVFRGSTLQGAYMLLAARAMGFDCGPMSGFDKAGVDKEFLDQHGWKSNFLCNIGYGIQADLFPRNPRVAFDEACLDL